MPDASKSNPKLSPEERALRRARMFFAIAEADSDPRSDEVIRRSFHYQAVLLEENVRDLLGPLRVRLLDALMSAQRWIDRGRPRA